MAVWRRRGEVLARGLLLPVDGLIAATRERERLAELEDTMLWDIDISGEPAPRDACRSPFDTPRNRIGLGHERLAARLTGRGISARAVWRGRAVTDQ